MSTVVQRVVGVTDERDLESRFRIENLHISWRFEHASQKQADPTGQRHLAPLVSWERDGQVYRYIPHLDFVERTLSLPRVLRQIGFVDERQYEVDADRLRRVISEQLGTLGCVAEAVA
ncbi:hypothetical protein C8D92_10292 [Tamilnaduibacter salinus]|uniref:Uncharacterized protein n=1 Tax=Tamilnaduibacter salinus TaxID=1484056 RepID=A0A2A2I0K7_9GAMM|nr:hypothetical protein [Tamilnaduibacter salinus]PAV25142.1 hypothetical protein CF392_12475 [Tamilnaduibacter salinus]PVY78057.1 hypothetical protein C8D92_10292 [Tamilnaduibacter salinus]